MRERSFHSAVLSRGAIFIGFDLFFVAKAELDWCAGKVESFAHLAFEVAFV